MIFRTNSWNEPQDLSWGENEIAPGSKSESWNNTRRRRNKEEKGRRVWCALAQLERAAVGKEDSLQPTKKTEPPPATRKKKERKKKKEKKKRGKEKKTGAPPKML